MTGLLSYLGAGVAVVLLARFVFGEYDPQGNAGDSWTWVDPPYDKTYHAAISLVLAVLASTALGLPPLRAALATLLLGGLWEVAMGKPSWRDLVADALGCALGLLLLAGRW